jgi:hypothetical protein
VNLCEPVWLQSSFTAITTVDPSRLRNATSWMAPATFEEIRTAPGFTNFVACPST